VGKETRTGSRHAVGCREWPWHRSRPRLAVGERQHAVLDLRPAQVDDLAPPAAGEQEKADDVGLLFAALPPGVAVERSMETDEFLPRQEACELRAPVERDAGGGIAFDLPAGDGEVQDLPEATQDMIGIAVRL